MEVPDSNAKKRMLPLWMTEAGADGKEHRAKKVKTKKKAVVRSPMKQAVYCMNEEELVGAALEVLSRSYKQNDAGDNSLKVDTDPESPSRPAVPQETSPMSGDSMDSTLGNSPSSPMEPVLQSAGNRDLLEEEDDPMKFVREIFFN